MTAPGFVPPNPILPPKQISAAVFNAGRWFVWRIDGSYMLYERRPYKARRSAMMPLEIIHHDFVACCEVHASIAATFTIDPETLKDARSASHFHKVGLS